MAKRTFTDWVRGIFDHPVVDPAWYWDLESDECLEADNTNAEYLTRLFSESATIFADYSDDQVGQGLWMIASSSCSNHAFSFTGGTAPWEVRQRAIQSIYLLYEQCFAKRCDCRLGHLDESENLLNSTCYMWWDLLPAWCDPCDPSKVRDASEYIQVMKRCLSIEHDACIEGALHGLGHWALNFPEQVGLVIDDFLKQHKKLRPELVSYAKSAREAMVQ